MPGGTTKSIEWYETDVSAIDPLSGEIKVKAHMPYPNYSGALATGGGLVFTGFADGTFVAYDDTTLEQLWKINVGVGFNAPPMTFEFNGKQYIAILSGLSFISRKVNTMSPELLNQRNQTMLFVFSL
jgi:alcohol dehydrogenase (cytochrome c)